MPFFTRTKSNATAVTTHLLHHLGAPFSQDGLRKALRDHPDFPSLLSVSDTLNEWHMPTVACHIARENYHPAEFTFPFIASMANNGGRFILVHQIADKQVSYSDENKKKAVMSEDDFLQHWTGILLQATLTANSGQPGHRTERMKDTFERIKIPLLAAALIAVLLCNLNYQAVNTGYAAWLLLKITGVIVSILLLVHSLDANNPFIQTLCSLGTKDGCDAILKTDAAKVTSWLSWSEVGLLYFTGSLLAMVAVPVSLPLLAWLNILSLPYTCYSVIYQYRQQNWCVLCCTAQVLLWLEFLTNVGLNGLSFPPDLSLLSLTAGVKIVLCFVLPSLIWAAIKKSLGQAAQVDPMKQQLKKFKYNSDLFDQMLRKQPRYAVPDTLMPVSLGDPSAATIITMVSNPFCGPCAKAHQAIDEWLSYRKDLQLKIIFTSRDKDDERKLQVARHVHALTGLNDPQLLKQALYDWYAQTPKKYNAWAEKYPVSLENANHELTEIQRDWCHIIDVTYTPTILVNGYKLPEPYRLEDIKYLLV